MRSRRSLVNPSGRMLIQRYRRALDGSTHSPTNKPATASCRWAGEHCSPGKGLKQEARKPGNPWRNIWKAGRPETLADKKNFEDTSGTATSNNVVGGKASPPFPGFLASFFNLFSSAEKLSPHEQCATAFGFVTLKPPFCRSSL